MADRGETDHVTSIGTSRQQREGDIRVSKQRAEPMILLCMQSMVLTRQTPARQKETVFSSRKNIFEVGGKPRSSSLK